MDKNSLGRLAKNDNFLNVFCRSSRTICSTVFRDENTIEENVTMYIDVFTSNTQEVPYNITVRPVDGFQLM